MRLTWFCLALAALIAAGSANATGQASVDSSTAPPSATVSYQIPSDGPLPRTYLVTLAIVDAQQPDWIISTFVSGAPRTVTAQNQGRFTETWNGLDENHMPVPPGQYGIKGIYMPAERWAVDGQYHAIVPKYRLRLSSWSPPLGQGQKTPWALGDPVDSPLVALDSAPNGMGVLCHKYLENAVNYQRIDFRKPIGYDQILQNFASGGAAGGTAIATDGEVSWCFSVDGGTPFVLRPDGRFGNGSARYRRNVYLPPGHITSMDAQRIGSKRLLYVAMRGAWKRVPLEIMKGRLWTVEDRDNPVNKVMVLDGDSAAELTSVEMKSPLAISLHDDWLYALHERDGRREVSRIALRNGLPTGNWRAVFRVPQRIAAADMAVDSTGLIYLVDPDHNHVHGLDARGNVKTTFGRADAQAPGKYDEQTFMKPWRIATWRDADGQDRLLVLEHDGPNRLTEWTADGKLLRQWLPVQTSANHGYAIDPANTSHMYMAGHGDWLVRFAVDWKTGEHRVDAVWPNVGAEPFEHWCHYPRIIHADGRKYIAFGRNQAIYRFDGDRCVPSAGVVGTKDNKGRWEYFIFRDENGDGRATENEWAKRPLERPRGTLRYWGEDWCEDLSLLAIGQNTQDIWRWTPEGFDAHGNPIFTNEGWRKELTDPIFQARAAGSATALFGGNELDDRFSSSWAKCATGENGTVYVSARGGPNLTANYGGQYKLSRYDRNAAGAMDLRWRVGRMAIGTRAKVGEITGAMNIASPINGLIGVVDQSRAGLVVYTTDGLYVDTVLPDSRAISSRAAGVYINPGEFFAGICFVDDSTGRVFLGMGKETPVVFELDGWTTTRQPVQRLQMLNAQVTLRNADIALPSEEAIRIRGGRAASKLAVFAPATGGAPALDGSDVGWQNAPTISFAGGDAEKVTVQTLYAPDSIYLRWHAKLGRPFDPSEAEPLERIFIHGRGADTLSFYFQGDRNAPVSNHGEARPGDVRIVFALTGSPKSPTPVALGMYKSWSGPDAKPLTYQSPVGQAAFANVSPIAGAKMGCRLDDDGKGFVLAARIPKQALGIDWALEGSRTRANFDATFSGQNRFWWSNQDGSASRETNDEPAEAKLYPGSWSLAQFPALGRAMTVPAWLVCGPWVSPEANRMNLNLPAEKTRAAEILSAESFPPDSGTIDLAATYRSEQTTTRKGRQLVRWLPRHVEPEERYVDLGGRMEKYFAATWVHVPAAMALDCRFTFARAMNEGQLTVGRKTYSLDGSTLKAEIRFEKGWNRVTYAGFSSGYSGRIGMQIMAPSDVLWQIGLRSDPPTQP